MIAHHQIAADNRNLSAVRRIASCAQRALFEELLAYPKPGLVSYVDQGSHPDMSAETFAKSIGILASYFEEFALAGAHQASMTELRRIGIRAERAMLSATKGVNTHRGGIFSLGLLCAAAGSGAPITSLGDYIAQTWGSDILRPPASLQSHGGRAATKFNIGGARHEAARGFPNVFFGSLPLFKEMCRRSGQESATPIIHTLMHLIASIDDTTLYHRGGRDGAYWAQEQAKEFLRRGGTCQPDWREQAVSIHHAFIKRNLSAGGCADLLACTVFLHLLDVSERI